MAYSKLHLVPILKGAVDPRHGIVFRTYYIRPERLREMIRKMHETPSKSYIVRIPHLEALDKAVKTGNILHLYDLIRTQPGGETAWDAIQDRHRYFEGNTRITEHRQRFYQAVYHYILSQDTLATTQISKTASKASYTWKLALTSKETPIEPKLKRRKVKEGITVVTTLNELKQILKTIQATKKQLDELQLKFSADYGIRVKYSYKLYKTLDAHRTGIQLSTLINLLNTNPAKVKAIVSSLISKNTLRDKYSIVGNTAFKPDIYFREAEFWSELLPKLIYDIVAGESPDYRRSMLSLYVPLLYRMDHRRGELLIRALSNELPENVEVIIEKDYLRAGDDEKLLILATEATASSPDVATLKEIIESVSDSHKEPTLGVATSKLDRNTAYTLVSENTDLSFSSVVDSMFEGFSWKWILGQIIFGKLLKLHFIPYREIAEYYSDDVYSPMIATKILIPYTQKHSREITEYLNKQVKEIQKDFSTDTVTAYIPKPKGNNPNYTFLHMNPVETASLSKEQHSDTIQIKVNKEAIIAKKEDKILILNPIDNIIEAS